MQPQEDDEDSNGQHQDHDDSDDYNDNTDADCQKEISSQHSQYYFVLKLLYKLFEENENTSVEHFQCNYPLGLISWMTLDNKPDYNKVGLNQNFLLNNLAKDIVKKL